MKDPREEKLPKWARDLLFNERCRAARAEERLQEHLQTVEPTPIWYGDYRNKIYVPIDHGYQTVYFSDTGKPTDHAFDEIGVAFRKGKLQIQGGRTLVLMPSASNVLDIALEPR